MKIKYTKYSLKDYSIIIWIILCFLFLSLGAVYTGFNIFFQDSVENEISFYFGLLLILLFNFSLLKNHYRKLENIDYILVIYGVYFLFAYNLYVSSSLRDIIYSFYLLLWLFSFKIGGNIVKWGMPKFHSFIWYFIIFVIVPVYLRSLLYYFQDNLLGVHLGGNDAIFAVSVYLPFIFILNKSKQLKIILIISFVIISFISYKRSIILSTVFSILTYLLLTGNKKNLLRYLFSRYSFLVVGISIILYTYFQDLLIDNIFARFTNLSKDKGSGRTNIYDTIWEVFLNSNGKEMFFGHGYQSTRKYVGVLAHNDFIQILFDFGIIGGFLYLIFGLALIKLAIKKYRNRKSYSNEYAAYVAALIAWLVMTLTNCFIYSPSLLAPVMFFIGMMYFTLLKKEYKY